jgi:small subunit ribosomal protein S8
MSMTDPIADMLTLVLNAQTARKATVSLPASKAKLAIAEVLQSEGYIDGVTVEESDGKRTMTMQLKYFESRPVIERIERVSRPGLRIYASADKLPKVQGGLGIAIISTSKGVLSDRQARTENQGGEVLCIVA